jgi:hypothetical protein
MKYLLPCSQCDRQHEVDPTQAGEKIQCGCGQELEIPSLRGLRDLTPVPAALASRGTARPTNDLPRRLTLVVGMLLIAGGLVAGAYGGLVLTQIRVPDRAATVDPTADAAIDELDPADAFRMWTNFRDEGLGPYHVPYRFMAQSAKGYFTRWLLGGLIAVGLGGLLSAGAMLAPRS